MWYEMAGEAFAALLGLGYLAWLVRGFLGWLFCLPGGSKGEWMDPGRGNRPN